MVNASNWSMTLLLSISPASNVTFGMEVEPPLVIVAEPDALRKPLAVAFTVYVPAGAVRLNVPSGLAGTEATRLFPASYRLTVTGFPAMTCPVNDPAGKGVAVIVGVFVGRGVEVKVGVGDSMGVEVNVGVGDSTGVDVKVCVAVADPSGVEVCEAVGVAEPSGVDVGDPSGVEVCEGTGVADPSGVDVAVGDPTGVGVKVAVMGTLRMVRPVPVEGRDARRLSPFETRAVHSIGVCPPCRPVTAKVKTGPLVVALLPLLPAIATMKLPLFGPLKAAAASAPKRLPISMLPGATRRSL